MWTKLLNSPALFIYIALATFASVLIGVFTEIKILLPVLNVLVAYPVLFTLLKEGNRKRTFAAMLFWAAVLGVSMVWTVVRFPVQAEAAIFKGESYRQEMFHWIRTGQGAEGNPILFVPIHLLHFGIFAVLSVFSGSLLSLLMGSVLMNYMSFYVGSLILNSSDTVRAALMGWHPWSIIRVAAFVVLGVILGEPILTKITGREYSFEGARPYFWAGMSGIAADIVLKTVLAPAWGLWLREILR